jgi:hypothetical protein
MAARSGRAGGARREGPAVAARQRPRAGVGRPRRRISRRHPIAERARRAARAACRRMPRRHHGCGGPGSGRRGPAPIPGPGGPGSQVARNPRGGARCAAPGFWPEAARFGDNAEPGTVQDNRRDRPPSARGAGLRDEARDAAAAWPRSLPRRADRLVQASHEPKEAAAWPRSLPRRAGVDDGAARQRPGTLHPEGSSRRWRREAGGSRAGLCASALASPAGVWNNQGGCWRSFSG